MDERYGQLIEPKQVVFAFGAPGWYVLAMLLLLLLAGGVRFVVRWYGKNRYRRQALAELKGYGTRGAYATNMLLKRVAIGRYGRTSAAGIRGTEWIAFLNRSRGRELFGKEDVALLEQLYSTNTVDAQRFMIKAKEWIRKHKHAL